MLDMFDLDKRISKEEYAKVFPVLESRLGELQRAVRKAGVAVIVVFEGWDAAGKGTIINRLAQTLDPRGFKLRKTLEPTPEEAARPWMWRFWNALPPAGDFAIFDRSWYLHVLEENIEKETPQENLQGAYEDILQFERQLTSDGVVIVKFWLHIGKGEQKDRFERLEKDPATAWRVGKKEWKQHRHYDQWLEAIEHAMARTSTAQAPWTVVEATHEKYVRVKVFETILAAVQAELDRRASAPPPQRQPMPEPPDPAPGTTSILDRVDLSLSLTREEYDTELKQLQKRLFDLEYRLYAARVPVVVMYEGWDAAGKGGNIRRLTRGLDPRGYEVIPIPAPTPDELARQYLWRFWRRLPKAGHIAIFDRSWYGRVLVERIEGFCTEAEWKRAYHEINEFESQLTDFGTVLVKFWLQIDQEEQLRRFQQRQQIPDKQWKITDEDWRNRAKWKQYQRALIDMFEQTSTVQAPWTILEANCKLYARIKALRTVADALEAAIKSREKSR